MATDIILPAGTGAEQVVGYIYNGTTWEAQRGNVDLGTLINAVSVTTTQTSPDQTNYNHRGVTIFVNVTNIGTGSIQLALDAKDPASGAYMSTTGFLGAAITANGPYIFQVYPGTTDAAALNAKAAQALPRVWRVRLVAGNANPATYTVGASLLL